MNNLTLRVCFSTADRAFAPFMSALVSQAEKMDIEIITEDTSVSTGVLPIVLQRTNGDQFTVDVSTPYIQGKFCGERELQAITGLMAVHSRSLGQISYLGVDYISVTAASLVMQLLIAGLFGRVRGATILRCNFDLTQAGLLAVGQYLAGASVDYGAESFLAGNGEPNKRPPFRSNDGILFELESLSPKPWQIFWRDLGVSDKDIGKGWHGFMQRYAKAISPIPSSMINLLSELSFSQLQEKAHLSGIYITKLCSLDERKSDEKLAALLTKGPWQIEPHDAALLNGYSTVTAALRANATQPLAGITVVESCRRIQGPMAGHLLTLLGATVIRIEPPGGDLLRGMPPLAGDCSARFDALNYLKQVREIDIKSVAGKAEIMALIKDADVFIHNWAPGKAAQLGLDCSDMVKVNPALIYAYAGGWGKSDNEIDIPGTDFMVQAYSGLADIISQHGGSPGGTLFTATDLCGGILAAQAVVIALYRRLTANTGFYVESSLLGAATLLSESYLNSNAVLSEHHDVKDLVVDDLSSLSSHPVLELFLTTNDYTRLDSLWRMS